MIPPPASLGLNACSKLSKSLMLSFMDKITTDTENLTRFVKHNVLVVSFSFLFPIACPICRSADGLESIS